ncbi:hypothetical protein Taro_056035 [Colocasia esculenta]|uniref:Uncharacterized protein n=1 Tax=Colocasia esculenta TaxID=4460 RepID=A0A843XW30_COLES|nr:hypothetical protein [Colocasia esculenta]
MAVVGLAEVHRLVAPCSSESGALVVLVEVLAGPACVLPRIALCHFWWRFFPGVLCVCFGPPLCCPCGSKCAVWLGCVLARFSQDGSWHLWWRFSPKSFPSFSVALEGLRVPVARMVCFVSRTLRALPGGALSGDAPLWCCVARPAVRRGSYCACPAFRPVLGTSGLVPFRGCLHFLGHPSSGAC